MSSKEEKGKGKMKLYKNYKSFRQAKYQQSLAEQRRFCRPLLPYLEKQYLEVLYHYKEFYKKLDLANPAKKDLTKSEIFKTWLNQEQSTTSEPEQSTATTSEPVNHPLLDIPEDIHVEDIHDWDFDDLIQYLHPFDASKE